MRTELVQEEASPLANLMPRMPKRSERGAMDLVFGVVAVVAIVIIIGIGLIILYNVQNTATTAGLTSAQSVQVNTTFANMVGSYGLLPILVIVVSAGLIISGFFYFVRPPGAYGGGM
jgi:hypothetical protein